MAFQANAGRGPRSEINVTPLIDVLLVLLIIFMMITPPHQEGLQTELPQDAETQAPANAPEAIVLEVRAGADGAVSYAIDRRVVAKDAVEERLRNLSAARAERQMFVRGDAALSFSSVAEAIGMAHRAHITQIGILR